LLDVDVALRRVLRGGMQQAETLGGVEVEGLRECRSSSAFFTLAYEMWNAKL